MMDAYLSREAFRSFEALGLIGPHGNPGGLLIGHKRGHRYFVESVFPALKNFSSFPEEYFHLDHLFKGKLIGFFTFGSGEESIKKVLAPFAYGKLLLEVRLQKEKISIKSFIIDYEEEFFLSPIRLKTGK
jgi:hypothetical protein